MTAAIQRVKRIRGADAVALQSLHFCMYFVPKEYWQRFLCRRRTHSRQLTAAEKTAFRKRCVADRTRLHKTIPHVPSDSGDDAQWMNPAAISFRLWCRYGSWQMCSQCSRMTKKGLPPSDLQPQSRRAEPLAGDVLDLRPLYVDCGWEQGNDHGYRVHSRMVTFSWKECGVETNIANLELRS